MIIKRLVTVGAALAMSAAISVTVSPPAATAAPVWKIQKANPGMSKAMLDSLPDVVKNSSVTIDSSYEIGTPIVDLKGKPLPGQSKERMAAAASSCPPSGTVFGPPGGSWGATSDSGCGVFGRSGFTQGYVWNIPAQNYTKGCVQGRGFNSSKTRTWYAVGCGENGGNNVPWGNVLATPATRASSLAGAAGFTAYWRG